MDLAFALLGNADSLDFRFHCSRGLKYIFAHEMQPIPAFEVPNQGPTHLHPASLLARTLARSYPRRSRILRKITHNQTCVLHKPTWQETQRSRPPQSRLFKFI